jgi:xanthine/CO dehydrogenase XdhC/CoxF family maturation factor
MSELSKILELEKRAADAGEEVCVATVVRIEGSAYRRPGARMVLTASGDRAGTVSGGCLEAEIVRKAWWLTAEGAAIQRYSSFFDDEGELPFGLGCGGTITVLLERGEAARHALGALRRSVEQRAASVIVCSASSRTPGTVLVISEDGDSVYRREAADPGSALAWDALANEALHARASRSIDGLFVEYLAPPPALLVFGAGDDAQPLVSFAASLGWHVTVADGRAHLARPERFRDAARIVPLAEALAQAPTADAAVLMTHSYDQDREVLRAVLPLGMKYVGILGPRRRTERLAVEIAPGLGVSPDDLLARLHAPVGLDLGGHSPEAIALSITAELQAVLAGREPQKLSVAKLIHA